MEWNHIYCTQNTYFLEPLKLTLLARLRIESWCRSLVLLAVGSRPYEAVLQLAGILDGGVALAALSGDGKLSYLD